ncbi:hypothetical protein Fot_17584 [Forsythia ovata]|uniref:Uncharacterized protein n=1 Tax=Forsythia ovata TaxID=205694 RepID=A0ABD1VHU4_9LAMI
MKSLSVDEHGDGEEARGEDAKDLSVDEHGDGEEAHGEYAKEYGDHGGVDEHGGSCGRPSARGDGGGRDDNDDRRIGGWERKKRIYMTKEKTSCTKKNCKLPHLSTNLCRTTLFAGTLFPMDKTPVIKTILSAHECGDGEDAQMPKEQGDHVGKGKHDE